jgi:hypothetical protein
MNVAKVQSASIGAGIAWSLLLLAGLAANGTADLLADTRNRALLGFMLNQTERLLPVLQWVLGWAIAAHIVSGQLQWQKPLRTTAVLVSFYGFFKLTIPFVASGLHISLPGMFPTLGMEALMVMAVAIHILQLPLARRARTALAVGALVVGSFTLAKPAYQSLLDSAIRRDFSSTDVFNLWPQRNSSREMLEDDLKQLLGDPKAMP